MNKLRNLQNKRFLAIVLCVCFVAVFLFATAYEINEADHICTGHDCPICAHMQQMEQLRQQMSTAVVTAGCLAVLLRWLLAPILQRAAEHARRSPVTLRVKLNN